MLEDIKVILLFLLSRPMMPEALLTSAILLLKSWLPAVLRGKWQSVNTAVNTLSRVCSFHCSFKANQCLQKEARSCLVHSICKFCYDKAYPRFFQHEVCSVKILPSQGLGFLFVFLPSCTEVILQCKQKRENGQARHTSRTTALCPGKQ